MRERKEGENKKIFETQTVMLQTYSIVSVNMRDHLPNFFKNVKMSKEGNKPKKITCVSKRADNQGSKI